MDSDTSASPSLHLGLLKELPTEALAGWGCVTPFWGGKMADPFSAEQATFVLQPEDLAALTSEASALAKVPLAGTNYTVGVDNYHKI